MAVISTELYTLTGRTEYERESEQFSEMFTLMTRSSPTVSPVVSEISRTMLVCSPGVKAATDPRISADISGESMISRFGTTTGPPEAL